MLRAGLAWDGDRPTRMKKTPLVVVAAVAASVLALATEQASEAAPRPTRPPTTPTGTPAPAPAVDPAPSIAGFAFYGGAAKSKPNLALKSIAYEVPVRVSGMNARTGKLKVTRNGSVQLNAPFTIASGETKTIPVVDSVGMEKSCQAAHLVLELAGSGFDVKKTATVTPTCSYQSTTVDPLSSAPPDRLAAGRKNHVHLGGVTASFTAPGASPAATIASNGVSACASSIVFKTTVKNELSHAVKGVSLAITLGGVLKGGSPPFDLAPGQTRDATAVIPYEGEAGTYEARVGDPNNSAGGALTPSSFHLDVTRSCSLSAGLDP
jgi:hypothetical protein